MRLRGAALLLFLDLILHLESDDQCVKKMQEFNLSFFKKILPLKVNLIGFYASLGFELNLRLKQKSKMKINLRFKRMSLLVCFIPLFIACEQNGEDPVPDSDPI